MPRQFTYSTEVPQRKPVPDSEYFLERVFLPENHLPLGYDASNPNHGWRVVSGGLAGNDWIRAVHVSEIAEVEA